MTATLNPNLDRLLTAARSAMRKRTPIAADTPVRVGVDLGTAYTVIIVTDEGGKPLCGGYTFADVVRDGIVWDFSGAVSIVSDLKGDIERRIGRSLEHAAVTIPPAVSTADHRAHGYVLQSAGLECTAVIDEPSAANAVLGVREGAVVDIGGGTTGTAVINDGTVVMTADEPTGGKHLSLVLAGALKVELDEAEKLKQDPANHSRFLAIVRPTLEKMATIVAKQIAGYQVEHIYLVGGTCSFAGIDRIVSDITGIPATVPTQPLFVTPLGVASFDTPNPGAGGT